MPSSLKKILRDGYLFLLRLTGHMLHVKLLKMLFSNGHEFVDMLTALAQKSPKGPLGRLL